MTVKRIVFLLVGLVILDAIAAFRYREHKIEKLPVANAVDPNCQFSERPESINNVYGEKRIEFYYCTLPQEPGDLELGLATTETFYLDTVVVTTPDGNQQAFRSSDPSWKKWLSIFSNHMHAKSTAIRRKFAQAAIPMAACFLCQINQRVPGNLP